MPIRSMTGFARVSRSTPQGEFTLSLKSVNHKGLDLHLHLPAELDSVEPVLRSVLRKHLTRGHVQVMVHLKRNPLNGAAAATINEPMLRAWIESFRAAASLLGLNAEPDLNQALKLPGMMESRAPESSTEDLEAEILSAAAEALAELDVFRMCEGAAIEVEIRERTASISDIVARMEDIRSRALPHFQTRLRDRLAELLAGAAIDPARLAQEVAMLAEKSDISEELLRLKTHALQTEALIAAEGETGKKLDFLLQEMNRETNTILSKTGGIGEMGLALTDLGLAAKAEIDRIREQSLNIE
jgi:uncharacterized protein (TIGR00255 family)